MVGMSYRLARRDDTSSIVQLVNSAYRGETARRGWTSEADLLDGQRTDVAMVTDMLEAGRFYFLLCERAWTLRGSLYVEPLAHHVCCLGMFAIHPDYQRQGLGKWMMVQAERFARDTFKARSMELTVISLRVDLIAWYARRGYICTNEMREFPYGDTRFGVARRPDLVFQVLRKNLD